MNDWKWAEIFIISIEVILGITPSLIMLAWLISHL